MSAARTSLLSELPDLIANEIKSIFPELHQCEGMAGPFNLEDLKATGIKAPAVLVSMLGLRQAKTYSGAVQSYVMDMAAYVVTKDALGLPRDVAAANICQGLLALIPDKCWGEDNLGAAQKVAARSLVTRAVKKTSASLWAVTWSQPVVFRGEDMAAPQAIELYVGQAPGVGADHEADYELIGGAP
ncbi:hypothetical protein [Profundibacter sp.]